MTSPRPKQLLVEDVDQRGAVIGLTRHHGVVWPPREEDGWPIYIHVCNSASEVLNRASLSARLKESELRALGLLLDADDEFAGRWDNIKSFCLDKFKDVPEQFPLDGLILENEGKRFGAWILPDNKSRGMIETFCKTLIPDESSAVWQHALNCTCSAKQQGAPFRDAHLEKARIHTWLAWQDPPGERMGSALTKRILNPTAPIAVQFVRWFKTLYEL